MKDQVQIEVNPICLVWARESLAISKAQAAERASISLNRLTQLEEGRKIPTLEELKRLSKTYKQTIATLLLNNPPKEKPLPKDRRTVNSGQQDQFSEKTILAIRKARALALSIVELRQELKVAIPKIQFKTTISEDSKEIANRVRSILNLHEIKSVRNIELAFQICIERIESLGIAVFQLSLPDEDKVRGFSITDDVIPIIGIKRSKEPVHAKIFTLFHELGHILLNEGGICDMSGITGIYIEKWCNAFAAEILVPNIEFLNHNLVREHRKSGDMRWTKNDLLEIGGQFHVGPLVILRRALDNNLTSKDLYQIKHIQWNKPQYGRASEPKGRELHKESFQERGRTYVSLAFKAYDQNKIDLKDLSDFLGLRFAYISKTRELLSA